MSALKPCPCCGGKAAVDTVERLSAVQCKLCGLMVSRFARPGRKRKQTEQECIVAWNTRTPDKTTNAVAIAKQ